MLNVQFDENHLEVAPSKLMMTAETAKISNPIVNEGSESCHQPLPPH